MERTAINPPKACFGLEQHHGNPICTGCQYRKECAQLMGELVDKVDVDKVPFRFMPPQFLDLCPRTDGEDPDIGNIENVYAFCYEWVFKKKPRGNISRHRSMILERVLEAGSSVKLFFLANMLGWKQTHAETDFYPQALTGQFAVKQLKTFSAACQERYGAFDITSLDRLMGSDVAKQDFETHLLDSEIVAGSWIINYKLFHSGQLTKRLYSERETALNPYWLAIEPTYYEAVLGPYVKGADASCSDLLRKHRWNTIQVLARLKKQTRKAIAVFSAREKMMPEAIRRVLGQRGLRPDFFQIKNVPIVDPIKFWSRLGSAIQHHECLKFVDNIPSVFDGYFNRI